MKPLVWYTLLRILLLIAVGGFAYAIGMRGLLLVAAAFVASGVMSYFLLRPQRDRLGLAVGGVFHRINDRIDRAAAAEDEATALRQAQGPPRKKSADA